MGIFCQLFLKLFCDLYLRIVLLNLLMAKLKASEQGNFVDVKAIMEYNLPIY